LSLNITIQVHFFFQTNPYERTPFQKLKFIVVFNKNDAIVSSTSNAQLPSFCK